MSACEKCWRDAHYMDADSVVEAYSRLIEERVGDKRCTPEEQAGEAAGLCPICLRQALHQHTNECMNCGCPGSAK